MQIDRDAKFCSVLEQIIQEHKITMVIQNQTASAEWFAKRVARVISIESNPDLYQAERSRLIGQGNILFLNADSANVLASLIANLRSEKILFFLPQQQDLLAIGQLGGNCVVVISQAVDSKLLEQAIPSGLFVIYDQVWIALPPGSNKPLGCFEQQPQTEFNPVFAKAIVGAELTKLRQHSAVIEFYDHVTLQQANNYLALALKEYGPELAKLNWVELQKFDRVGDPVLQEFPKLSERVVLDNYRFSTLFFRYLYTALELLSLAVQDRITIVEIGGGFGGQSVVLLAAANQMGITITDYHWIDNQESNELKLKFLEATGVQTNCAVQGITYRTELNQDLLLYYDIGFSNFTLGEQTCQGLIAEKLFPRCRALRFLQNREINKNFVDFQVLAERPPTGAFNVLLLRIREPLIHVHLSGSAERALHQWGYRAGCTKCQGGIAVFNEQSQSEAQLCPAEYKILWLQRGGSADHPERFQEVWSADPDQDALFVPCISTSIPLDQHKIHAKSRDLGLLKQDPELGLAPLKLKPWSKECRFAVLIGWEESRSLISEALLDCFLTGTVPICFNQTEIPFGFGDPDGILFFESVDELQVLENNMEQMYESYQAAVERNFESARDLLKLDPATPASRIVQVQLSGGLGEQLFQIATGLQYSHEQSSTLIFSEVDGINWAQRFGLVSRPLQSAPRHHQLQFKTCSLPGFAERITLSGQFQSDRGIEKTKAVFHSVFAPLAEHVDRILNGRDSMAIHLHRHRQAQLYPQLGLDYYRQAIAKYGQGKQILIFTNDAAWASAQFPEYTVHCNDPSLDLYAMSKCSVIVGSNSEESWWAGWLSPAGTTVLLPQVWFSEQGPKDWSSIYYSSMRIVDQSEQAIVFQQLSTQRKIIPFYLGDQNEQMEKQLESWGMPKLLIEGEWSSAQSHIQVLKQAAEAQVDYVLVFKDSFVGGAKLLTQLKSIVDRYTGLNVLCLDGESTLVDELVGIPTKQDTTAYLVSSHAISKLIQLLEQGKSYLALDRIFTRR